MNHDQAQTIFRQAQALLAAAAALTFTACATPAAPTAPRTVSMASATCPATNYPAQAKRLEATGTTQLEFEVNAEGKVTRVAIVKSSGGTPGHQALDRLALDTISKCSFPAAPGFLSGTGRMAYVWKLEG